MAKKAKRNNVKIVLITTIEDSSMGHAHSDVTMDVYNHLANKQDIKEEVERYAKAVGN